MTIVKSPAIQESAAVIITAAGSSRRMGDSTKKEYQIVEGLSVLASALKPFIELELFNFFVITIPPEGELQVKEALKPFPDDRIIFTQGGATRRQSVYNGLISLKQASPEYVLIHDGCRPWISKPIIEQVLNGVKKHGACVPVISSVDAMKEIDSDGFIRAHLSRTNTFAAQTPQGFIFSDILNAHSMAHNDRFPYIDDTEIYNKYSGKVFTIPGNPVNRKITYLYDLENT